MNCNQIIKLLVLCVSLLIVNGCAYYKAMDIQKQRQAIIESNLVQAHKVIKEQEVEKLKLEKEVILFKSQISSLDKEIEMIKKKTQKAKANNMKNAQEDYNKQLAKLKSEKTSLQQNISKNNAIIEVL